MELKNRLYNISRLSGTYYQLQSIKRRFKVKKRIPDHMFNEAMRQILFHHSSWILPNKVFEFNIGVLSGRFTEDNEFYVIIEIVSGLRNIAGTHIRSGVSTWDGLWYNYFDYETLVLGNEELFTLNEWFDLGNIQSNDLFRRGATHRQCGYGF